MIFFFFFPLRCLYTKDLCHQSQLCRSRVELQLRTHADAQTDLSDANPRCCHHAGNVSDSALSTVGTLGPPSSI